ncbi:MAG: rod shape-determining protein MreC [Candidatus Moraniibacteriota bacterium]|nr:MAG: rod shape-determining protein MreC [Candidatus Moranbacteria bacterium]
MRQSIFGQKKVQIGIVVILFLGISFLFIGKTLYPIRSFFWTVISPVASPLSSFSFEIRKRFALFSGFSNIRSTNEQLFYENKRLESRIAELESASSENELLREQLNLSLKLEKKMEMARIIGYGDEKEGEWIVIDKGNNKNFKIGMPVFAYSSILIGRIEEVYSNASRIKLLTSQESVVNVRVSDSRTKGIVRGRYGLGLLLDMVLSTEALSEGDRIITSDIGVLYPPDLFVGKVRDIRMSDDGLAQQATIDQGFSFSDLEFISVNTGI